MVDLDSNPTKLLEIVQIGKQTLITRGALTTFSIANDVSKYFAIIPAAFVSTYPVLGKLNVMRLATPQSAILSAVIFNAIIIVLLIPLALRGVKYTPLPASELLKRHLVIYGLGGIIVPFIGIKAIDMLLSVLHLVEARMEMTALWHRAWLSPREGSIRGLGSAARMTWRAVHMVHLSEAQRRRYAISLGDPW
jgi:K+-transporting ATPase ATPase B chain